MKATKALAQPNEIRILINKICNYNCSFPNGCVKWCHEDGIHKGEEKEDGSFEDFVFLARSLKKPFDLRKIKIAGMEPLLYPKIADLIRELKNIGYREISLTTNGFFLENFAQDLADAGLDNLTISIHSLDPEIYRKITGVNALSKVLRGIDLAKRAGIKSIKINRVLLKFDGVWQDVNNFVNWAEENKFDIKFYELIKSDKINGEDYFKNYLSWRSLLGFFHSRAELEKSKKFTLSGRERLFWRLKSGIRVETDIFHHKFDKDVAKFCHTCPLAHVCQEGLFSFGLEINSQLVLSPCLLREDIFLDLFPCVKKRNAKDMVRKIKVFRSKFINN